MYSASYLPLGAAGGAAASLPFTGFGVFFLVLAAVALLALGGAMRRLAPARQA